jgi:Tfp pilus assembly protein PilN
VLREFSLVLPDDVWLTQLSLRSPISPATNLAADATTGPVGFTIEGSTYSHDAVARLLSRLSVVPDLTNVQLVSSAASQVAGQGTVRFSIAADIRDAEKQGSS